MKRDDNNCIYDVVKELHRAREKFPGNDHLMTALMEEVGELAEACLKYGSTSEAAYGEAMQVAAVAIRIMSEGDSVLYIAPEPQDDD